MQSLTDTLESLEQTLAETVSGVFDADALRGVSDAELLSVMAVAARIVRRAEGLLIEGAGLVQQRSEVLERDGKLTTAMGCRSVGELLQRVTRSSARTVAGYEKAAKGVRQNVAPISGVRLEAEYPALRRSLAGGFVGVDGLVAAVGPLEGAVGRAAPDSLRAAEAELAAAARGEGADGSPAATTEELRQCARIWAMFLDQDGAEPREHAAMRKRSFTIGKSEGGLTRLSGWALDEVVAQFATISDALLNPKLSGPRFVGSESGGDPDGIRGHETDEESLRREQADPRSRGQKLHDVFATILGVAARSGELPTLGGAAPTLVVSVRAEDLAAGTGYAHVQGAHEPVSLAVARHIGCVGVIERVVLDRNGRAISIETHDRVFNHHQRRAIALRDGGCIIPGCGIPASWCEIHHVIEHSRGGPTHTDNGVLVCWFHHRTIDNGDWCIRMRLGVPEVRGPLWWDPAGVWRAATKSHVRMRDRLALRT